MKPTDRERIQVEVVSRLMDQYAKKTKLSMEVYFESLINDTLYYERRRLEKEDRNKVSAEIAFYEEIRKQLGTASEVELQRVVQKLAKRFVSEIVGNFDERIYRLITNTVPTGLWALLNAMSPGQLFSLKGLREGLADRLCIQGETEKVKALLNKGTLIVVPTHSSNLDSIILGYAVYLMGLPPLTYGAGLNLFTNPLTSFFMRNLGAYRVDRKKNNNLYKDVLKEYATCSLEMGYHNLFFPGGTRSRSGSIEQKLKKGLLGTAIRAYIGNLCAKKEKPNIYIVPCTISYTLVLEAETLIDDHLQEVGKSRYIIEDDEFSKPRRIYNFISELISLDARIAVTFSSPLDVFGNKVDVDGNSSDSRGRPIDPRRYVSYQNNPIYDEQRDAQYTRELSDEICKAFLKDNVILSTSLVAFSVFDLLVRHNPKMDQFRLLRTGGSVASFHMSEVHMEVDRVLKALKESKNGPRLDSVLMTNDVCTIVADALKAFGSYHTHAALMRHGDRLFHEDRNLLLYYGNRLRPSPI